MSVSLPHTQTPSLAFRQFEFAPHPNCKPRFSEVWVCPTPELQTLVYDIFPPLRKGAGKRCFERAAHPHPDYLIVFVSVARPWITIQGTWSLLPHSEQQQSSRYNRLGRPFCFCFLLFRVCVCVGGGGGGSSCFVQWLLGVVPGLRDDPSQRSGGSIGPQTPNTCLRHPPWKKVGGIESEAWGVPSDRLRVQTVYE